MNIQNLEDDIPESLAYAAHSCTSHVPDERTRQERTSYAQSLRDDYANFIRQAEQGGTIDLLHTEFARYRQGVAERTRAYLSARSRVISPMITGPANFPVARNRKRSETADKRLEELVEFRKRARAAILRVLRPDLRPIRSSDSDAVERLQKELAELEAGHELMKSANAALRKHKADGAVTQIAALVSLGFAAQVAGDLVRQNRTGFADYELQNSNANIRRLKDRIESVRLAKATPTTVAQGKHARLENNPTDNRVRLYFPGKPTPEVIKNLKANAFRWTPSLKAWQAYRNRTSLAAAQAIAEIASEQDQETTS